VKLTKGFVKTAGVPDGLTEKWYLDDEVKGLALRVQRIAGGVSRAYMVRYTIPGHPQRKLRIGEPSRTTLEDARKKARAHLGMVDDRKDPKWEQELRELETKEFNDDTKGLLRRLAETAASDKDQNRVAEVQRKMTGNITLAEVAARFLSHQANKRKSWKKMKQSMEAYILPALGEKRMRDLSPADAQELHDHITAQGKSIHANRIVALLSSLWSWHEKTRPRHPEEPRRENPCRFVERNQETKRERYLSEEELGRLGKALVAAEERGASPSAILALRLLVMTGARKSEILNLKREQVDFQHGVAFLPTSKTGQKVLPLGNAALELIQQAPQKRGNPYVCPNRGSGPLVALQRAWEEIRRDAKLPDVHIHDLRHTFASAGVGSGYGLPVVGRILGHTSWQTTERYAHLADTPVRKAVNAISGEIGSKLLAFPKAKTETAA
jgi:integrase